MPAPAAPGSYTRTPDTNAPVVTHAWTHGGTDLAFFQLMHRKTGDTAWIHWAIYPKADVLVSGTNYQVKTPGPLNHEWLVRAMSVDGLVST